MARSKGTKSKTKVSESENVPRETVVVKAEPKSYVAEATTVDEPKTSISKCRPPHLSVCQCQDKLSAGQAYFVDGPTDTHIIADASRNEAWFRAGNDGKGSWINKKR